MEAMMGATLGERRKGSGVRRWRGLVTLLLAVAAISAMLLTVAGCDEWSDDCDEETIEIKDDSFAVGDSVRLVVKTGNGAIEVNSGSDGEVLVEATLRVPEEIDYSVTQDGDTINVVAEPRSGGWRDCKQASFVITVPAKTDVDLRTSNGRIELVGIEGSGRLETSNGEISLDDVKGDFDGGTSNGRIDIDTLEGSVELDTSNGAVSVRDAKGEFELETSNGRISFSGELVAGGNNRLVTSNGQVDVELEGTPSVRIEAATSTGEITTDLPLKIESVSKNRLVGTIGDAEADLYVSTSNGDVDIR